MFGWFKRGRQRRARQERLRYAAAQVNRLTGNWVPAFQDINELIAQASPLLRYRTQQLVRDFPPFGRAVNNLVDFIIGQGIRFQSQALGPDNQPDRDLAQRIEDRWQAWMDQADIAGRLHFHELQRLARRQQSEAGEYLAVYRRPRRPGRHPLAIQFHESHALTDLGARPQGRNKVFQGVEYDSLTGEIFAYHFADSGYSARSVRVDAADVLHDFQTLRPGQLRGVSPFAPAILLAKSLADFITAEVDAAKLASKWLAFVKAPDPEKAMAMRSEVGDGEDSDKRIEELENAIIEYLEPGEDVSFASHNRPVAAVDTLPRFLLRMTGVTVNVPYELLSGDYTGMNYNQLRGVRNDFAQFLVPQQQQDVLHFCRPVFAKWMDMEVLTGGLDLRGYWRAPERYRRGQWIPAGMRPVDPQREFRADIDAIKARIKSPQEVILARGGDPEKVLDQIQAWAAMCADRNISVDLDAVSTALANNPAALAGDEAEEGQE